MPEWLQRFVWVMTVGVIVSAAGLAWENFGGSLPIVIVKPPFETDAPRALVVIDEGARGAMTSKQIAAFEGADVRDWTDKNLKEFKVIDKGVDKSSLTGWLKDAWNSYEEKSKGKLPWVVISNGKTGDSSPYAENPVDAIAMLEKHK